jgi:hypothetical protein
MIHILLNYVGTLSNLSLTFQGEVFFFLTTVELHVKSTLTLLESLKCSPGQNDDK